MEMFLLPFMQRALLAALLTGLIAPAIGTYIVQRRLSLLGDGLGHVAIAGVGLAMATGTSPLPVAIVVCVLGAIAIELLRQHGRASGDVGLAILFYGGLAAGVLMAGLAGRGAGALSAFLFGSLMTVGATDLWTIVVLSVVVLVPTVGLAPQLFAVSADEAFARVLGLHTRAYNLLIVVLAAITVTISMRTVGVLLVSALMVVPTATANNVFHSFRTALLGAMGIGAVTAVAGTMGSYWFDAVPGGLIVVLSIVVFLLSWPISALHQRRHVPEVSADEPPTGPLPHEAAGEHPHRHGDCEHPWVQHGDHRDYIHDGHRHAVHGDHYDEH